MNSELSINGLFLAGLSAFCAGAYFSPAAASIAGGIVMMGLSFLLAVKRCVDVDDDR
jgi:hypothetical protein